MKFPSFHPLRTPLVLIVFIGGGILLYLQIRSFA